MVRLQAKQEERIALKSVKMGDSQVAHVAKALPPLPGTTIKNSFIKNRQDSWQCHLQRISPYLVFGKGIWWTSTDSGFLFFDGDTNCSGQMEGPSMLHFRRNSVRDVENKSHKYVGQK